MNPLITICARGGSKGLPGKNWKPMLGKPLVLWTLDQAWAWGKGKIAVSSDSLKILDLLSGATKIVRPEGLAQDDTPKLDVIRHAHWYMEMEHKTDFDPIIDLDVTNPLRTAEDIENAYSLFVNHEPDTLFSVTPARRNPYFNMVEGRDGYARISKPFDSSITRRQDVPICWDMNCCIYIYKREWLMDERHVHPVSDNSMIYPMPEYSFLDTDTELDFFLTEKLFEKYLL